MASVTLVWTAGGLGDPLEPNLDGFGRTNSVVVKRRNGSEAAETDVTGPRGTLAIGKNVREVTVNTFTDEALPLHAHYYLLLGTDPDPRYPKVVADLDAAPALAAAASAIDVGDHLGLQAIRPEMGQPSADLMALGYQEVIGSHRRVITFNTQPGRLFRSGVLDGGASACLQTGGAQLSGSISATQTSITVATTSGPIFTTSPPVGAQIIINDREVVTVVSITGGASPQNFTVTRDPARAMAHVSLAPVRVYRAIRAVL